MVLPQQLVALGVSVVLMIALAVFFKTTHLGKWMQATADNVKAAKLVGIRTEQVYLLSFGIGAAIAAVAAVVMAPITLLYPDIGFNLFLKAFAAHQHRRCHRRWRASRPDRDDGGDLPPFEVPGGVFVHCHNVRAHLPAERAAGRARR